MRRLKATEHENQKNLFLWANACKAQFPELGMMFSIPNGGRRDKITGARLKAEGVRPGVPDVCLPVARGGFHALYIELKTDDGGVLRREQGDFIELLRKEDNCTIVAYGWDEAKEHIEAYLNLKHL